MKLRALDLFCGAGGMSVGLAQAGWDVTGVDVKPQPRYPFAFRQADAMQDHDWEGYDLIAASPPCQRYSVITPVHRRSDHPDLIAPIRQKLQAWASADRYRLWVIENVPGAPLERGSVMLCGLMFGLKVVRHRWFETSFFVPHPLHPDHPKGMRLGQRGHARVAAKEFPPSGYVCVCGNGFRKADAKAAMGIDHDMTRRELAQAIPPAYGRYIGESANFALESRRGAA